MQILKKTKNGLQLSTVSLIGNLKALGHKYDVENLRAIIVNLRSTMLFPKQNSSQRKKPRNPYFLFFFPHRWGLICFNTKGMGYIIGKKSRRKGFHGEKKGSLEKPSQWDYQSLSIKTSTSLGKSQILAVPPVDMIWSYFSNTGIVISNITTKFQASYQCKTFSSESTSVP